jgi:hypothetical protein
MTGREAKKFVKSIYPNAYAKKMGGEYWIYQLKLEQLFCNKYVDLSLGWSKNIGDAWIRSANWINYQMLRKLEQ